MNINTSELFVLAIPFMGTTLGAAMVFLLKDNIAPKLEKLLLGFSSGVMIAASVCVFVDPIDRYAKGEKWCGMAAGFGRIFGWHCIFIAFGYGNTAFTSEKYRAGGNISKKGTYIQNNDDAICGYSA